MEIMQTLKPFESIWNFVLLLLVSYPILGAFAWFIGVLCYQLIYRHRHKDDIEFQPLTPEEQPFITIMIPAHNEEVMLEHTINYLMNNLNYEKYEVLVTDDGSTDETPAILERLQSVYDNLRVVTIKKNQGKAHAFNVGVGFARGKFILSNDADSIPEPDALWKYMSYFMGEEHANTAAVTANMDVQNRSTIIAKSQTVEFSSIVGVIKRSQVSALGNMYAYSGANTMYRRDALIDVGLFRQDRATEDISIAWDHQLNGWTTVFSPDILFYMNVPENLDALYHQRKRWAKGGTEVLLTNFKRVVSHPGKYLKQWAFITDQTLSIIWSLFFFVSTLIFLISLVTFFFTGNYERVYHMFCMAFIFVTFEMFAGVLQLLSALIVDDRGRKFKYLIFMPLYMLIYWQVNALALVTTLIPAVKTILGYGSGTWVSPVRKHHTE
ncbi:glycosyltransferase, family 2 [Lactobacillus plantarum WCFS1] [Lactiplantibacillus plantarum]|uniref:Glycosyltransferase, family 2 n=1 Tax=Lactiplantibacillus plantarum CMPG5300 TaxID=1304889 RepID=A0AAW3FNC6_LACPN|nr:glycosyltransferase family 2 protein [Lactiplantibacillus plantarum]ATI71167.1 glycosyl transferase [Lactiplantibacillus plantarum]KGH42805.1 glycosyltransferase, family 2 [Lactiplantibacillus plantarum CMPG5300]MCZ2137996.1 glycosyltransferase [Lactiplantibacillus plantarum]MCZ2274345.1 glycosyltransferase [Lactiplantibacillus plantarum]VTU69242.1 glycosyltransferase, family 2 [Lactobacillus plantarum WCFS1] [Lactiplantibacillus plantarum]